MKPGTPDDEAALSVLTDLVEEKGLADIVALLRAVQNTIHPLADLLKMTGYSVNVATLAHGGELNQRIMALSALLNQSKRFEALAKAVPEQPSS